MKVQDILDIDFSKHKKVILDKTIITGARITAKKDQWGGVVITGFFYEEYAFSTFYDKEDEVRINEKEDYLSITRKG